MDNGNNYLNILLGKLPPGSLPINNGTLDALGGMNLLNPKDFNDMQKQKLTSALTQLYLQRGQLSPVERFGQGTSTGLSGIPGGYE